MKTIQIAPYRDDCRIEGRKIIGAMDGRTLVFELPEGFRMPRSKDAQGTMVSIFCEAIALSSRPWQVERLLNDHWGIEGGKFYEI